MSPAWICPREMSSIGNHPSEVRDLLRHDYLSHASNCSSVSRSGSLGRLLAKTATRWNEIPPIESRLSTVSVGLSTCRSSFLMGTTTTKAAPGGRPSRKNVRRRPTLPRSLPRSTIGAEGLSFRVRNGAGRFPLAMATETLWRYQSDPDRISGTAQWTRSIKILLCGQALGLLVPVSYTHYCASTSGLSTQCSRWGPYQVNPVGVLILERASRLDAFSGYPFRT